jgi:hypothetical protein
MRCLSSNLNNKAKIKFKYQNLRVPSNMSGFQIVERIRTNVQQYGSITSFRAYYEADTTFGKSRTSVRSELQTSGVSLVDCPHNGKKEVVDKTMIG